MSITAYVTALDYTPRDARFWTYLNGGLVKLTLHTGETLRWMQTRATEEGYSTTCETWEFDGRIVYNACDSYDSDCDGPHESHADYLCHVNDLHAGYAIHAQPGSHYPSWVRTNAYQRDVYAESMGY